MRDNRVRQLATADAIAKANKTPIFIFESDGAKAVYVFGKRVFASKEWNEPSWWQRYKTNRRQK